MFLEKHESNNSNASCILVPQRSEGIPQNPLAKTIKRGGEMSLANNMALIDLIKNQQKRANRVW